MSGNNETLLRITSGYFSAGVVLEGGVAVLTAPILDYMKGWPEKKIINYAVRKRWEVTNYSNKEK